MSKKYLESFWFGNQPFLKANGMRRSVDLNIGRNQYTAVDPNRFIVHKCAIHVDDNIIPKDVLPVIAVNGVSITTFFPMPPNNSLKNPIPFLPVMVVG